MKNSIFRKCALFAFFLLGGSSVFPVDSSVKVTCIGDSQTKIVAALYRQVVPQGQLGQPRSLFTNCVIPLDNPLNPGQTALLNTTSDINSVYEYTVPLFTRDSDVFVVVIREGNDDKRGTLRKCENIIQQARRNPAIIAVYQVSEKNPLPEIPREVDDWCNEHGGSCICVELNSENSVADKASKHHAQDFSESTYADKTGKDDEQDFSESTDVDKTSKHHAQKDFSKVTHATSFGVERAVKGIDDLFREINKRCIEKIEGHEKPGGVDIAAAADATAGEVPPSCC